MKLKEMVEILQINNVEFDVVDLLECHDDEILDEDIYFESFSDYIRKLTDIVESKIELCKLCCEMQTVDSYNDAVTERGSYMSMYKPLYSEDVADFIQRTLRFNGNFCGLDLVEIIEEQLTCPKCESEIHNGEVYFEESIDNWWGLSPKNISDLNKKYGIDITSEKFNEARKQYIHNPLMLSYNNPLIKDFIKILDQINEKQEYNIIKANENLFRGRIFPNRDSMIKLEEEFLAPPKLQSSHGRFNLMGETGVLYLANRKEIIPYELNYSSHEGYLYIANFKSTSEIKLININAIFYELDPNIFFNNSNDSKHIKEKYILPNIFSACVKHCKFDGIIYTSVHDNSSDCRNIALFNECKIRYLSNQYEEYKISYQQV